MNQAILRSLPVGLALVPVGILFGALAAQADWSTLDVLLMSSLGFSGSGQFALLGFHQHEWNINTLGIAFLVVLSMNLRYIPMTLSASQPIRLPATLKAIFAHTLADESYATETVDDDVRSRWLIRLTIFLCWVGSTCLGCWLSDLLPASLRQLLAGLTFPVSAILFALSALNLITYAKGPAAHRRPWLGLAACLLISIGAILLLGARYFWIPGIAVCYGVLTWRRRTAYAA